MDALTGPALAAATMLVLAGAQKLLDPSLTVGALHALRLPSWPWLVRLGSAAELAIGVAAVAVGGRIVWWLIALSYVAFAAFVIAALRQGTMIGSCGCFGREETPPHPSHVVLNAGLAVLAGAAALSRPGAVAAELVQHPGAAVAVVPMTAFVVYLLYAAFVQLPRTLVAGRAIRPHP
jgi:hypothetical protein